jgi:hypothetical protein
MEKTVSAKEIDNEFINRGRPKAEFLKATSAMSENLKEHSFHERITLYQQSQTCDSSKWPLSYQIENVDIFVILNDHVETSARKVIPNLFDIDTFFEVQDYQMALTTFERR